MMHINVTQMQAMTPVTLSYDQSANACLMFERFVKQDEQRAIVLFGQEQCEDVLAVKFFTHANKGGAYVKLQLDEQADANMCLAAGNLRRALLPVGFGEAIVKQLPLVLYAGFQYSADETVTLNMYARIAGDFGEFRPVELDALLIEQITANRDLDAKVQRMSDNLNATLSHSSPNVFVDLDNWPVGPSQCL